MKRGVILVALLLLQFSLIYAENPLYEGFSFIEKGDYNSAFSTFSSIKTKSAERSTGMGIAKYMLGDYNSALSHLMVAQKSKSEAKKWVTNYFIALSFYELKRYDEALIYFENVIRLKKDLPEALFKMGVCYHNTGDIKSALTILKKALELKQDFLDVYLEMINIFEEQNMFDEAFNIIDAGLKIFPDNPEIIYQRAKLLFKSGKLEDAEKELERASKLAKNSKIQKLYSAIEASKKNIVNKIPPKKEDIVEKKEANFSNLSYVIIVTIASFLMLIIGVIYFKKRSLLDDSLVYIDDLLKKGDITGAEELLAQIKEKDSYLKSLFYVRYYVMKNDFNAALTACQKISDVEKRQTLEGLIMLYFDEKELFKKHLAILEVEGAIKTRNFLKTSSYENKEEILTKIHDIK